MEESRKQFEAWFSNDGKYPEAVDKSGGDYLLTSACAAWEAWQASRATVEIELPELEKWRSVEPVRAQIAYRALTKEQIIGAGLRVKEK